MRRISSASDAFQIPDGAIHPHEVGKPRGGDRPVRRRGAPEPRRRRGASRCNPGCDAARLNSATTALSAPGGRVGQPDLQRSVTPRALTKRSAREIATCVTTSEARRRLWLMPLSRTSLTPAATALRVASHAGAKPATETTATTRAEREGERRPVNRHRYLDEPRRPGEKGRRPLPPDEAGQRRQQDRFDAEHPYQTVGRRAERDPHAELAASIGRPRQLQVHYVAARDEEDADRHEEKHAEHLPRLQRGRSLHLRPARNEINLRGSRFGPSAPFNLPPSAASSACARSQARVRGARARPPTATAPRTPSVRSETAPGRSGSQTCG